MKYLPQYTCHVLMRKISTIIPCAVIWWRLIHLTSRPNACHHWLLLVRECCHCVMAGLTHLVTESCTKQICLLLSLRHSNFVDLGKFLTDTDGIGPVSCLWFYANEKDVMAYMQYCTRNLSYLLYHSSSTHRRLIWNDNLSLKMTHKQTLWRNSHKQGDSRVGRSN